MFGEAFLVAELLDLAQERALLDAIEGILNSENNRSTCSVCSTEPFSVSILSEEDIAARLKV